MIEHASPETGPALPRRRIAALAVLGPGLLGLILTSSFAAYLATVDAEAALALAPGHPGALTSLAASQLDAGRAPTAPDGSESDTPAGAGVRSDESPDVAAGLSRLAAEWLRKDMGPAPDPAAAPDRSGLALSPAEMDEIRALANRALVSDPLNARAMRILAELAMASNNEPETERLMREAARRSLRESVAVYWLMLTSHRCGDHDAALRYADALLRSRPVTMPLVAPLLAQAAESKEARGALASLLAGNPPWRASGLKHLMTSIGDGRTPLKLLLDLKNGPAPPTREEIRIYLDFLISRKLYETAYYAWLQFLTQEQLANAGHLFNGSFEDALSGLPFDWTIAPGSGFTADRVARAEKAGEHAFMIDFEHGRVDFRPLGQLTLLAPGDYRLAGKFKGELVGQRGLVWRVTCAGERRPIGESPMLRGLVPSWKEFEVVFTVPRDGCRAQSIRLELDARSASERMLSGSLLIDEVAIVRAPKPGAAMTHTGKLP